MLLLFAVPALTQPLANPGFEKADASGAPAGWRVYTRLDPNRYGAPDYRATFDEIKPVVAPGGRSGSANCAGFPRKGLWHGEIRDHFKPQGAEAPSGREFGKAALAQTVTLDPGSYVFGAYLRTADGDGYTAAFSLGYNTGEPADYANDGSTGIKWSSPDLALKTSFNNIGFLTERGEWYRYTTMPFTVSKRGKVTVWIRFNFVNNNSMSTRWQVDDAFIEPCKPGDRSATTPPRPTAGMPLSYPPAGMLTADCGDDEETYLSDSGDSTITDRLPHRMFQHARRVESTGAFTYTFPIDPKQSAVYVAFEHFGPCSVTFGGRVTRVNQGAPDNANSAAQYMLTDRALWRNGKLTVTFQPAQPSGELAVDWIDCGSTTRYRERLKHIEWDTVGVPWSIGLWDAFDSEFGGNTRVCVVGKTDIHNLKRDDMRIEWDQKPRPGHRYYLVLGYYKTRGDVARGEINIGDDDLVELIGNVDGEEALDFDITDYLKNGRNVVSVKADAIDFVALIDTVPGITDSRRLGIYFGGDRLAENITRVLYNSMFWILSLHYYGSGFLDASIPRGKWWQQYWPIDISMAMRSMLYWGYTDQVANAARLCATYAWQGHSSNRSGGSDNNGGNIIATDMCEILLRSGFDKRLTAELWPCVESYCNQVCDEVDASPFGLIKGTNWENAGNREQGPCYALSTNLLASLLLRKASDTAAAGSLSSDPERWRATADRIRKEIADRLIFTQDVQSPTGWTFPKGTWAYGILDDGSYMLQPLAGYLWAGNLGAGYYGFVDPDKDFRRLYELTVGAALPLVGGPAHVVSGYASSYDGEQTMFACAALADRVDYMDRIVARFASQTDYDKDVGSTRGEVSRWAYGSPGDTEDTNLVCVAEYLDWPRYITGIDDLLYQGAQLRLIPRLPLRWNECGVNAWKVQYLDGGHRASTTLDYNYKLLRSKATLRLRTADPITGVRVRVGPFPPGSKASVTIDGKPAPADSETSGGYEWLWTKLDAGSAWRKVEALVGR